jgi:hypothetical protein
MAMMNLLLPWRWKHRFSAVLDEKLKSSRDTATQQISNACELLLRQTAQEISNAWELLLRQTAQEISNACELLLRQTAQEMSNSCEQVAQQFAIGFNELGTTLQKYRTE